MFDMKKPVALAAMDPVRPRCEIRPRLICEGYQQKISTGYLISRNPARGVRRRTDS